MRDPTLQLLGETFNLPPEAEWAPPIRGWWLFKVESGSGYILSAGANHQLDSGAAIRISASWLGRIRASQIGPLILKGVHVEPSRLHSLVSLPDERRFAGAARDAAFALRIFNPAHPISLSARYLFNLENNPLLFRVTALQIFVETFEQSFAATTGPQLEIANDAAQRLQQVLRQIPSADLIHINLEDLVQRVRCTPRHFSRLFRDFVGVSFREKQTEIRLNRAVQLLARTDCKVVDVAFESGFGSVSLFNTLFKRRFRVPPRVWRQRTQSSVR